MLHVNNSHVPLAARVTLNVLHTIETIDSTICLVRLVWLLYCVPLLEWVVSNTELRYIIYMAVILLAENAITSLGYTQQTSRHPCPVATVHSSGCFQPGNRLDKYMLYADTPPTSESTDVICIKAATHLGNQKSESATAPLQRDTQSTPCRTTCHTADKHRHVSGTA